MKYYQYVNYTVINVVTCKMVTWAAQINVGLEDPNQGMDVCVCV
jgi:hypothetical protein